MAPCQPLYHLHLVIDLVLTQICQNSAQTRLTHDIMGHDFEKFLVFRVYSNLDAEHLHCHLVGA